MDHVRGESAAEGITAAGKIVLVVRSPLFREGLRRIFQEANFDVVGEASTEDEIFHLQEFRAQHRISFVIVESSLCSDKGSLLIEIRAAMPDACIVLLISDHDLKGLRIGNVELVDSIISFETPGNLLPQILKMGPPRYSLVATGFIQALLNSNEVPGQVIAEAKPEEPVPSRRESEILRCLVEGCSNKVIARNLGIAEATVKVHLKGLLRKIRAANRTQAAVWALDNGIGGLTDHHQTFPHDHVISVKAASGIPIELSQ